MTDLKSLPFIFNKSKIEYETNFEGNIKDKENNKYFCNCSLFNPEDSNIVVLCKINNNIINSQNSEFHFDSGIIKKEGYYITLESKDNDYYFNLGSHFHFRNILSNNKELNISILKKNNDYKKIIGSKSTIFFITDYKDNELNIFNSDDIEEKTSFESIVQDDLKNEYKIACRLWKPKNDYLRIFCSFQSDLNKNAKYIYLANDSFIYNDKYNIFINYIKIK